MCKDCTRRCKHNRLLKYEKKKILLIHSLPSPYRNPLLERLANDKDVEFTICFMAKSAKNRIWDSSELKFKHTFLPAYTLNIPIGDDIIPIWNNPTVPAQIRKEDYDLVICSGWDSTTTFIARITCFLLGIPMAVWAGSTINEKSLQRTLMHFPVKFLVKSCTALIAYGQASTEYLLNLGCDPKKIFISYNSVDIDLFRKTADELKSKKKQIRKKMGIKNKHLILFVGQLINRKGVIDLYNVTKQLNSEYDVGVLWVGYGPLEEKLKQMMKLDNLENHYFYTTHTAKETAQMYAVADLFVLPTYEDIYSNVVAEALASGLPVITTKENGASRDYIKSGQNGYTVPAGDPIALEKAIRNSLKSNTALNKLANNTWKLVKDFNYQENVNRIKEMIDFATSR